jgi:hypothetical protein
MQKALHAKKLIVSNVSHHTIGHSKRAQKKLMADDLAAQIVAAAQTAEELAPTKEFLVVSVDDHNPLYVNYKKYEGQSNRGNPKYSDYPNLLQSLLNSGWRIERQISPVCDMQDDKADKPDWQPRLCFVLSKTTLLG